MNDKIDKILTILAIITAVVGTILLLFFVYEFKEMLNDYRCNHLSINEFFQDEKCEKYWRYK